ncbi:hypothetical protein HK405_015730, partial [Cladochytrium tenue]
LCVQSLDGHITLVESGRVAARGQIQTSLLPGALLVVKDLDAIVVAGSDLRIHAYGGHDVHPEVLSAPGYSLIAEFIEAFAKLAKPHADSDTSVRLHTARYAVVLHTAAAAMPPTHSDVDKMRLLANELYSEIQSAARTAAQNLEALKPVAASLDAAIFLANKLCWPEVDGQKKAPPPMLPRFGPPAAPSPLPSRSWLAAWLRSAGPALDGAAAAPHRDLESTARLAELVRRLLDDPEIFQTRSSKMISH